ncbi:endo-1,4-beta-xylanase [Aliiglaciecola sp. SL4]|uniref:endo-1,4-beta-xylanase n=1 Tax=Aliiglaciecola sp. SL4 TaxID=3239806 RepID=UPI00355C9C21
MKHIIATTLLTFVLGSVSGCANTNSSTRDANLTTGFSLHQAFSSYFNVGVAINTQQANGKDRQSVAIIDQHFNTLTAENDMKWESIQPNLNQFTFDAADALVAYAKASKKDIIGHTLVWHQQTPDWVFEDKLGNPISRDALLSRMKAHIFALAGRYKNDIKGWDVVNEAFNEDGSLRDSKWSRIIGPDFIEKAFEYAHQAAPNAELYYNDYNLFKAEKMDSVIALAKRLKAKGIRIDGIGEQGHYGIEPPFEQLESSIKKVAEMGLSMMITELDITVLKFPDEKNMGADISLNFALEDEFNPYVNGISKSSNLKLANAYKHLFALFLRYQKHIDRVTFWGVSDNDTWRNNWPMHGRTDYPLLFNRDYQAKAFVKDLVALANQYR